MLIQLMMSFFTPINVTAMLLQVCLPRQIGPWNRVRLWLLGPQEAASMWAHHLQRGTLGIWCHASWILHANSLWHCNHNFQCIILISYWMYPYLFILLFI